MLDHAQVEPNGMVREVVAYDTLDGLYDCTWSEASENVLLAACGDGSVKLYDVAAPPQANPLRQYKEHRREVRGHAHTHTHTHMQNPTHAHMRTCAEERRVTPHAHTYTSVHPHPHTPTRSCVHISMGTYRNAQILSIRHELRFVSHAVPWQCLSTMCVCVCVCVSHSVVQ